MAGRFTLSIKIFIYVDSIIDGRHIVLATLKPKKKFVKWKKLGKKLRKSYKDFVARIFQHEYDHLEGLMFTDRLDSLKDLISEKEYQKLIKKK